MKRIQRSFVTRVRKIAQQSLTVMICLLLFSSGSAEERPDLKPSPDCIAQLRCVPDSLGALVKVGCLGDRRNFCIDTGSSFTTVDESLKPNLGPQVGSRVVRTGLGDITVPLYSGITLSFGDFKPKSDSVICTDFGPYERAMGHKVAGTIGLDIISAYVVEMDLAAEQIQVFRTIPDEAKRVSTRFKIYGQSDGWRVIALLPDGLEDFLLDTGSDDALSLENERFDRLRNAKGITNATEAEFLTPVGKGTAVYGTLESFQIGRFQHKGIDVKRGAQSAIGRAYLRRFIVTLDFPRGHLYLRPSGDYNAGDPREDRSGLMFVERNDQIIIDDVKMNGPGYNAGIRVGDRILKIRGHDARNVPVGRIQAILSRDGELVQIVASRDGTVFSCELHLRDLRHASERKGNQLE